MSTKFSFYYPPKFFFEPKTGRTLEIYLPLVPIQISFEKNISHLFFALVDSGADSSLFPAEVGETIGLKIKKGMQIPAIGIGEHRIITYRHKVGLKIEKVSFDLDIDFSYEHKLPVLGRKGFFDQFRYISFKERQRRIDFQPH